MEITRTKGRHFCNVSQIASHHILSRSIPRLDQLWMRVLTATSLVTIPEYPPQTWTSRYVLAKQFGQSIAEPSPSVTDNEVVVSFSLITSFFESPPCTFRLENNAELEMRSAPESARKRHSDDSSLAAYTRSCHDFSYAGPALQLLGLGLEPEGRADSLLLSRLCPMAFCIECNMVCY